MSSSLILTLYFVILSTATISGLARWKKLDKGSRIIVLLLCCTIIFESTSLLFIRAFNNNRPILHIFSPIELLIICIYFNETIELLKKYRLGWWFGFLGLSVGLATSIFLQSIWNVNSIFLIFEAFAIILLCIFSFYQLLLKRLDIIGNIRFWVSSLLLFYWSSVFLYWGFNSYFESNLQQYSDLAYYGLGFVNMIMYLGFALIFFNYKKMNLG